MDEKTTAEVVAAANVQADKHDKEIRDRYFVGRGKLYTVAKVAVGPLGNLVTPGSGRAPRGPSAPQWRDKHDFKRRIAWSLFVLDARLTRKLRN